MGRIEKDEHMTEELSKMKNEVVTEIRKSGDGRRKLTCSLLFLAAVLGMVGWWMWMFAATGLYAIPIVTSLAYEAPQPVRVVTPGTPIETLVQSELTTTLTRRLQESGGVLTDTTVSVTLPESAFTATLQSFIEKSGFESAFDVNVSQITIREAGMFELFLPIQDRKTQTAIVASIRVELVDDALAVHVDSVRLGSYRFPRLLTDFFTDTFIKPQIPNLNAALETKRIRGVTYQEGRVTIDGEYDVEIRPSL